MKESVFGSKKVIEYRGKLVRNEDTNYIWQRLSDRDGGVAYSINRDLPQVQMIYNRLDQDAQKTFELLLQVIEQNFPASRVYLDVASGDISEPEDDINKLKEDIELQLASASDIGLTREELLPILLNTEPYSKFESLRKLFREGK